MTRGEVDHHVEKRMKQLPDAVNSGNLQKVFDIAKPVLEFLSTFWLVPKTWRAVIIALVVVMEAVDKN